VTLLYRDGYYYACISLSQSVAEAIVRFMCQINSFRADKDYESNVDKLFKRKFIDEGLKKLFIAIWDKRNDYHHLNSSIEKDKIELDILGFNKLQNLNDIEKEVFGFTTLNGSIIPKHPKYWDIKEGFTPAYLKLEP